MGQDDYVHGYSSRERERLHDQADTLAELLHADVTYPPGSQPTRGDTMVFGKHSDEGYANPLAGISQKTLVHGEKTLMTEFVLKQASVLPLHSHPHEQTGYLLAGHILLTIGDQVHDTLPGDSWCIPGGVTHGARIVEDSVAIEIFAPVREDYLPR